MFRFYIVDEYTHEVEELLVTNGIPYDIDGGDRIMIDDDYAEDVTFVWDQSGIGYEEI